MDLPIGYVALAVRYRAPVVTTVCVFDGDGGFKFVFGGPHYPREDLAYDQAMRDLQNKCILDMTTFIQAYPDQWFHFQPFGGHTIGDHGR
jgi:lauroyl/myristoyl acyltransferase